MESRILRVFSCRPITLSVGFLLVSRGEAPLGIVYATDAAADTSRVRVVGAFPADSHPPIIYPIALTRDAVPAAEGFLAWLRSAEAAPHFERQGFTRLP